MFSNDFRKYLKWICIPFIIILLLPLLLTKLPFCIFDFSNTGQVGDTIGGIMGPFVAIQQLYLLFSLSGYSIKQMNCKEKILHWNALKVTYFSLFKYKKK